METFAALALAGFLLGIRHALDPDHVVAVTTIAARHPQWQRASLVGALWGVGHTITLLAVGGAMIVFRVTISARLGLALEFTVAVMLIVLGLSNLRRTMPNARANAIGARPLAVGMVHGLAGSAGVALLVLAAVGNARWAMAYLLLFSAGTAMGMALVTSLMALPARATLGRFGAPGAARWMAVASGVVSVAFGLFLTWVAFGPTGVFSATPSWTPH